MATYYVDTSILVKLFVSEAGSENARTLLGGIAEISVFIASVTRVEFTSALSRRSVAQFIGSTSFDEVLQ
ncbi:MAG: PIN domain-containing protein, partial [Chthonomonadales bacterium]